MTHGDFNFEISHSCLYPSSLIFGYLTIYYFNMKERKKEIINKLINL